MTMAAKGLAKLVEELGELQQVVGKRLAYYHDDAHPDGGPPLNERLVSEMGDVVGAISFVCEQLGLDMEQVLNRSQEKLERYRRWDATPGNNQQGVDHSQELDRVRQFAEDDYAGKTDFRVGEHLLGLLGRAP